MIRDHDYLLKLILIGSSGVGKSSILTRYAENRFTQDYMTTIGVDFRFKTLNHNGKKIKLQVWDTAGQQRFRTITSAYYKGTNGIMMVYDITDQTSLQDIQTFWIKEAKNYCGPEIKILLLGNKSDCQPSQRKVTPQRIKLLTDRYNIRHEQVSAKMGGERIAEVISAFGVEALEDREGKVGGGSGGSNSNVSSSANSTNNTNSSNSSSNSSNNANQQKNTPTNNNPPPSNKYAPPAPRQPAPSLSLSSNNYKQQQSVTLGNNTNNQLVKPRYKKSCC